LGCRPGSGSPWLRWAAASDRAVQSIGFSPDLGTGSAGLSVGQWLGPYAVHRHLTLAVPARLGCCGFGVFVHVLLYRATSGALFVPLATFRSLGIFLYLVANTVHGPRRTHFDLRLLHLNSEFDASGRQVCGAGRSSSTHLSASIDRCNASAHAFALSVRTPPRSRTDETMKGRCHRETYAYANPTTVHVHRKKAQSRTEHGTVQSFS
jgi:hypothetical protein